MIEQETITIPLNLYKAMKESCIWLECFEAAGIDNWDGYEYALALFNEQKEN